jgi:hypothetical protein
MRVHQRCSAIQGESQARTARSARGQDGGWGGLAGPGVAVGEGPDHCGPVAGIAGPVPGQRAGRVHRGVRVSGAGPGPAAWPEGHSANRSEVNKPPLTIFNAGLRALVTGRAAELRFTENYAHA